MWGQEEQQEPYEIDNLKGLEMRNNVPTVLFLPLLKNPEFRSKYINRFCDYVNEIFKMERIDALIEDYTENYLDLLANGEVRWKGFTYQSELEAFANFKTNFVKMFETMRTFLEVRPEYAMKHMKDYLNIEGDLQEISLSIEGKGKIKINSIIPEFKEGKWVGKYFANNTISITAIPSEKSEFKGWSGASTSKEKTISLDLTKDTKLTAKFE